MTAGATSHALVIRLNLNAFYYVLTIFCTILFWTVNVFSFPTCQVRVSRIYQSDLVVLGTWLLFSISSYMGTAGSLPLTNSIIFQDSFLHRRTRLPAPNQMSVRNCRTSSSTSPSTVGFFWASTASFRSQRLALPDLNFASSRSSACCTCCTRCHIASLQDNLWALTWTANTISQCSTAGPQLCGADRSGH